MTKSLEHRGHDGYKTITYEHCCMGHTRLAIRDLQSGTQPMTKKYNGKEATIVFNGEIYQRTQKDPKRKD